MLLEPISIDEFRKNVDIRFSNINDGFDNYSSGMLEIIDESLSTEEKEKCFIEFFRVCYENNINECYIDFYLKNLQKENIDYLLDSLEDKYKEKFEKCVKNLDRDTIYFKIKDVDYMDLITVLNTRSLFFCTVYLINSPVTIWGNYNLRFPIFFKDKNHIEKYILLAKKCGLGINSISYKK